MKLKYYMRGLGIGMVVTAFILSVVIDKDTKTMSDDEILARAKELGMVESTVLSQMSGQNKEDTSEEKESEVLSPETEESQMETQLPAESESTPESEETTETEPDEPTETEPEAPVETEPDKESETQSGTVEENPPTLITIVITPGESSESVCRSMEKAGLVESARELDRYLCDNGYDHRISIGTYEIPAGSTAEEIAKIITKSK